MTEQPKNLAIGQDNGALLRIGKTQARRAWRLCLPILATGQGHRDHEAKPLPVPDEIAPFGTDGLDGAILGIWPGANLLGARFFIRKLDSYVLHLEFTDGSNPYLAYRRTLPALLEELAQWTRGYVLRPKPSSVPNQFHYEARLRLTKPRK